MTRESYRETYLNDTTFILDAIGDRVMHRGGMSGKLGLDYYLSDKTTIGFQGQYGTFDFGFSNNNRNHKFTSPVSTENIYYLSESDPARSRGYYGLNVNFLHMFDDFGQKLEGLIDWSDREGDSYNVTNEWETDSDWNILGDPFNSNRSNELSESDRLRIQLDYYKPIGEEGSFSAGLQSRMENEIETYVFDNYDPDLGWINNPLFSSDMDYSRD